MHPILCLNHFLQPTNEEGQSSTANKIDVFVNFESFDSILIGQEKKQSDMHVGWSEIVLLFLLSTPKPKEKNEINLIHDNRYEQTTTDVA